MVRQYSDTESHRCIRGQSSFRISMNGMRLINRTAVGVVGAQPYIDWMNRNDADVNKGMLTVARAQPYGSVFLLPEADLEEDVQEWVEENCLWLFEFQLAAWTEDESLWPATRDIRTFREWFRIDIFS